ncbi:hypothetical protein HPC49_14965 [Pyxidicoccus fallax]|uniref:Uncharacterized protein n=1 Tax=Pyxidicoccus fallax TaxID=394095 RepID=A0A848L7M6_9BACT|nr:hypothetical protein [Pyxidicoccus fallax]NMO14634.1 hypothetical protein [Pyxidicoccus fallax]NPC79533.1 hypothetical protein [Pyxidicoccus fallax]
MSTTRHDHTATRLKDGRGLVTGGNPVQDLSGSSEVFNAGTWTATGATSQSRFHHTATLLKSGHVLIVGGFSNSAWGTYELYYPPFYRRR